MYVPLCLGLLYIFVGGAKKGVPIPSSFVGELFGHVLLLGVNQILAV